MFVHRVCSIIQWNDFIQMMISNRINLILVISYGYNETNFSKINPLLPSAAYMRRSAKILILIEEGIIKKISYKRRDYESVDEKSLSLAMSRKTMKKKNSGSKGLIKMDDGFQ